MKRSITFAIIFFLCMHLCACIEKNVEQEIVQNTVVIQETSQTTEATIDATKFSLEVTEPISNKPEETEMLHQTETKEEIIETTFKIKEDNISYGDDMTDKG